MNAPPPVDTWWGQQHAAALSCRCCRLPCSSADSCGRSMHAWWSCGMCRAAPVPKGCCNGCVGIPVLRPTQARAPAPHWCADAQDSPMLTINQGTCAPHLSALLLGCARTPGTAVCAKCTEAGQLAPATVSCKQQPVHNHGCCGLVKTSACVAVWTCSHGMLAAIAAAAAGLCVGWLLHGASVSRPHVIQGLEEQCRQCYGSGCPLPTTGPDSGRVAQCHKVQQCCHGQLSGGRDGSRSTPAHGMQQCVPVSSSALHATSWDSEAVCWQAGASSSTGSGLCTQLGLLLGCNECANPVPRSVLLVSCSGKYLLVKQHRVWSSSC